MKLMNTPKIATVLATLSVFALITGCGGSNAAPIGAGGVTNTVPGTGVAGLPAGCLSIAAPIGFSDSSGYMDSINFDAGLIPVTDSLMPGQTFGTVVTSLGGSGGPYIAPNQQLTISPDGNIAANAVPIAPGTNGGGYSGGYGYGGQSVMITGSITLSAQKQSLVAEEVAAKYPTTGGSLSAIPGTLGFSSGLNTNAANSVCIVNVALSLSHNSYNIYGGNAYLYFYLPYMNTTLMGTSGTTPNLGTLTGAALLSLPKIQMHFGS